MKPNVIYTKSKWPRKLQGVNKVIPVMLKYRAGQQDLLEIKDEVGTEKQSTVLHSHFVTPICQGSGFKCVGSRKASEPENIIWTAFQCFALS